MSKLAFTFEEAAESCGYSIRTLKTAAANHELLVKYANSKGVIRLVDLDAWLDQLPSEAPTK